MHSSAALAWSEAEKGARSLACGGNAMQSLADGVVITDCVMVVVCALISFFIRYGAAAIPLEICATALLAAILLFNVVGRVARADRPTVRPQLRLVEVAKAWSLVFGILAALVYLTKSSEAFARSWAVAWYVLTLMGFALIHLGAGRIARQFRRSGRSVQTVAIVDLAGIGDALGREMVKTGGGAIRLAGVFHPQGSPERQNGVADLIALSRVYRIDEVVVAVGAFDAVEVPRVMALLATAATTVRLHAGLPTLPLASVRAEVFMNRMMITVQQRPLSGLNGWVKRFEDLLLSSAILIIIAPVLLAIALVVRLDSPGPVLFRQRRLGFNNNVFTVYKFRTMFWQVTPESVVPQATRGDPRVTRIGSVLRRFSLDELPQIFNVLQGNMSLVGPRPHALAHNEKYAALIDGYLGRHRVQPGITGWAQVSGFRGETDTLDKMEGRVKHDLAYIDNWSILLDLKIIAKTAIFGAFDRKAY